MISIDELSRQVADLCPEDHLKSFLARDCRPDGRALQEARPIVLAKNVVATCDYSSLVRLGKTKCLCGIRAELVMPEAETPDCGMISINFEFSSLSSSNARSGPPDEKCQSVSISLDNIVKNVVDLTQLSVERDQLAWALFVDVYCLEDDGNVFDAALLAITKALSCLELPLASVETDGNSGKKKWHVDTKEKKVALHLKETPISTTYGEFGGILLIDPTLKETQLGR